MLLFGRSPVNPDEETKRPKMPPGFELPAPVPTVFFGLAVLTAIIGFVMVSGHVPLHGRNRRPPLPVLVLALVSLAALAVAGTIAYQLLPWYAAVIVGGLALLAAPLIEQALPSRWVASSGPLFLAAIVQAAIVALCAGQTNLI